MYKWKKYNCISTPVYGAQQVADTTKSYTKNGVSGRYMTTEPPIVNGAFNFSSGTEANPFVSGKPDFPKGKYWVADADKLKLSNVTTSAYYCVPYDLSNPAFLSTTYNMSVKIYQVAQIRTDYSQGSYVSDVTSADRSAYPDAGRSAADGYWYVFAGEVVVPHKLTVLYGGRQIVSDTAQGAVNILYGAQTLATLTDVGRKTLLCAGKYMVGDIIVSKETYSISPSTQTWQHNQYVTIGLDIAADGGLRVYKASGSGTANNMVACFPQSDTYSAASEITSIPIPQAAGTHTLPITIWWDNQSGVHNDHNNHTITYTVESSGGEQKTLPCAGKTMSDNITVTVANAELYIVENYVESVNLAGVGRRYSGSVSNVRVPAKSGDTWSMSISSGTSTSGAIHLAEAMPLADYSELHYEIEMKHSNYPNGTYKLYIENWSTEAGSSSSGLYIRDTKEAEQELICGKSDFVMNSGTLAIPSGTAKNDICLGFYSSYNTISCKIKNLWLT